MSYVNVVKYPGKEDIKTNIRVALRVPYHQSFDEC